ncbi:MAG: GTP-binding protein [Gammaproteobacteria bacterium]|nr:GTP-binding protein [Gammaproteobacteria bacterium]
MTQVPVTVLTGYLGAGKTTLLNHILTENHGRKYAVVINEFGELGVDNDIVVGADEEIFEMNNGCICCTVRGDLIRIIGGLMKRPGKLDGIIVETTGMADPGPVAQTFYQDDDIRARTRLDAIVTVVDAHHFLLHVDDSDEAREQVAFADVVLLNKTDLVTPAELATVERRLRQINPYAKLHHTRRSALASTEILDRGAFDLKRILEVEPDFLESDHDHEHDQSVGSLSLTSDAPIDEQKFQRWISTILREFGTDIFRSKGILDIGGAPNKYVFQGVHMLMDGDWGNPWKDGETRSSKLVFIGRKLDAEQLRRGFEACAVR